VCNDLVDSVYSWPVKLNRIQDRPPLQALSRNVAYTYSNIRPKPRPNNEARRYSVSGTCSYRQTGVHRSAHLKICTLHSFPVLWQTGSVVHCFSGDLRFYLLNHFTAPNNALIILIALIWYKIINNVYDNISLVGGSLEFLWTNLKSGDGMLVRRNEERSWGRDGDAPDSLAVQMTLRAISFVIILKTCTLYCVSDEDETDVGSRAACEFRCWSCVIVISRLSVRADWLLAA
jgi:hypothetical protein